MTKKAWKNTPPMYYLSLELENIKCFGEKQTLDLSNGKGGPAPWTILLGDNSVGKTTLLQILALMRPVVDPEPEVKEKKGFVAIKSALDALDSNDEYERLLRVGNNEDSIAKVVLTNRIKLNGSSAKGSRNVCFGVVIKGIDGKLDDSVEKPVKNESTYLEEYNSPNIYAYSASRHMVKKNTGQANLRDPVFNLFSETADLYDAEEVLVNLHHRAKMKTRGAANLLVRVKALLVDILPFIKKPSDIEILGPAIITRPEVKSGVHIQMPSGKVPLSALSMGYSTMFAWAVDLALRMFERFPDSMKPLEEPAVVIIDEIDLHLHPKWQRIIRENLTKHFPNTQFISTAHSPLMAQASESENIAVLKLVNDEVHIINNSDMIKGWRVDQILTSDLFGITSSRSPDVEKLVQKRRTILNKKTRQKTDEIELAGLDKQLSNLPTLEIGKDKELRDLLEQADKAIKSKRAGKK